MKPAWKMRLRWGFCLLVVLAFGIVALSYSSKPKLYQGKTVREWVGLLDPHVDHQKQREEASWALVQVGAEALPELENILAWRQSSLRESLRNYAVRLGLTKPGSLNTLDLQSRACEAAYNLAERANVDTSRLVAPLQYHFTNGTYADYNSGRALAGAGPAGIAVLTNLLITGKKSIRDNSGLPLHLVNKRPEVIAALIQSATTDPDKTLRANALGHLRGCAGRAEQLVPLGLKFLRSDDGYDRWNGALLLQEYSSVREVQDAFQIAVTDSDQRVRSTVESALKTAAKETSRK